MIRTQIQLTKDQAALLKKLAAARNKSMAELIRQAVDRLMVSGGVIDIEQKRRKAIEAAGKFHSGARDISTKHDAYLAEAFGR